MRRLKNLLAFVFLFICGTAHAQIITTIAGTGSGGYSGDFGPATAAMLSVPHSARPDTLGNVYVADMVNNRIRMIMATGDINTIVGNGSSSFSGDGGPVLSAGVPRPLSAATDAAGNIYIAQSGGSGSGPLVRKGNHTGTISTFAGGGTSMAENVPATDAAIDAEDVAVDRAGNVYITEAFSFARIRKINTLGIISTVAGNGTLGYSGDGGPATAAQLGAPLGIAVDTAGNIIFTDNNYIRRISTAGIITTIGGNGSTGYVGDGGAATAASFTAPTGVAVDAAGNVYVADRGNGAIRKINTAGIVTTVAGNALLGSGYSGDGGPATAAQLAQPDGVGVDAAGNIYIADAANNRVRKVSAGPLGIAAVSPAIGLHIWPQPSNGTFSLYVAGAQHDEVQISITNVAGQVVKTLAAATNSNIPLSLNVPAGIYVVTVQTATGRQSAKIVVE